VHRVAVVTGASKGIGAATALVLAERGWDVVVGYQSDADGAAGVVAACEAAGRRALAVPGDMAVEADVVALFEAADGLGPLDVLVNNAGIAGEAKRVDELPLERIERMVAVNVVGPLLCSREAVRRLSTRHGGPGGTIVNVSSAAARTGGAGQYVDYAATKGALDSMTVGLAKEVGGEGIRVNGVRPGIIRTGIHAAFGQPDRADRVGATAPLGRPGEPEEVAAAIAWLCSEESSYVTGAILDVSGGR
jgi:NAD(P)-dependent dehydrogenase (short-subunit alcohol dehydrogenase family)